MCIHALAALKPPSTKAAPISASTTSARTLLEILRLAIGRVSTSEISRGIHRLPVKALVMIDVSKLAFNAA